MRLYRFLPLLKTGHLLMAALMVIMCGIMLQTGALLYLSAQSRQNVNFLSQNPLTRYEDLHTLRKDLGYGGFIHHFKNAVLRGAHEPVYTEQATADANHIATVIKQYRMLSLMPAEVQALNTIESTVNQYTANIPVIKKMYAHGITSATQVDNAVRVNDAPALKAFETLEDAIHNKVGLSMVQFEKNARQINILTVAAAILSLLSCLLLVGFILWFRRLNVTTLLNQIMQLARNVNAVNVAAITQTALRTDEIGTIAKSILSYKSEADSQKEINSAMVNAVHDAIITISRSGIIQSTNPATSTMFGYEEQEMVGQNIKMLMPLETATHHDSYLKRYKATGQSAIIGRLRELMAQHKTGTNFPIELNISELSLDGETFFTGVIRNITERKKSEDQIHLQAHELKLRAEELERSNADLEDFAYIASHDLREPLRGLHNYATFLNEDYADKIDDEGQRQLQSLMKLSQRLDTLVSSLLYYSRVGRQEMAHQPTPITEIVTKVTEDLRDFLQTNNASVSIQGSLPTLVCDHIRVGEIFRNLITNAIKYNDSETKTVTISAAEDANGITTFTVADNGIGIPPEHRETVFRMFKRLHKREDYQGGTGAGLTIIKKIIERHGGTIHVEDAPGGGSAFVFTLQPQPLSNKENPA